jgi:hypothetical protein
MNLQGHAKDEKRAQTVQGLSKEFPVNVPRVTLFLVLDFVEFVNPFISRLEVVLIALLVWTYFVSVREWLISIGSVFEELICSDRLVVWALIVIRPIWIMVSEAKPRE